MSTGSTNWKGLLIGNGRYQVGNLLGQGGMADVYLARDLHLESAVVVKIPKMQILQDTAFKGRFDREIRLLVELAHPHIIKVHDYGLHAGIPFFVMPYMGGGSLDERRPRDAHGRPLPMRVDDLKPWLAPVADALDFIYKKQFAHRDIKPENILFDENGNVYVSDLGIAKALGTSFNEQQTAMTKTGMVIGTPEYMAPELIMGKDYDGRVDQYSLGILIYEMLAGRVPFKGNNATATLVKHTTEPIPPINSFNPHLPSYVWGAVKKALAKTENERFASSREFADAVLQAHSPPAVNVPSAIPAPPPNQPKRAQCPFCNRPFLVPPGSLDKALRCPTCKKVIPASTVTIQQSHDIQRSPFPPTAPPQPIQTAPWQESPRRKPVSIKSRTKAITFWTCIGVGVAFVVVVFLWFFSGGSDNEAMKLVAEGDIAFFEKGDHKKALAKYTAAIEIAPHLGEPYSKRGDLYAELGQYAKGLSDHSKAVAANNKLEVALTYRGLTNERMGNIPLALADYDKAIRTNESYGKAYWARCHLFTRTGQYDNARADAAKALKLYSSDDVDALFHRATINIVLGTINIENNTYFTKAIEQASKALEKKPNYLPAILARIWAFQEKAEFAKAHLNVEKAVESHGELSVLYSTTAQIYQNQGNWPSAVAKFDKAIKLNGKDPWLFLSRGVSRYHDGHTQAALNDINQAIDLNPKFAHAFFYLGWYHFKQNNSVDCLNNAKEAIQLYADFADVYRMRAMLHYDKNEWDSARLDFEKVLKYVSDDKETQEFIKEVNTKINKEASRRPLLPKAYAMHAPQLMRVVGSDEMTRQFSKRMEYRSALAS